MAITLNDENFEKEILNAKKPILVDFWMFDCAPCFLLSPILEKLARDFEEKIILAKVNINATPIIAQKYGINATPTVILFKDSKPVSGFIGLKPESAIREWLENLLKDNDNDDDKIEKVIQEVKEDSFFSTSAATSVYEEYAEKNGFALNPNKKVVEGIVKSLLEREKKFGFRYCPCRKITGNEEEDKKIICPCQFHRLEIEKDSHCLCGLFVKT